MKMLGDPPPGIQPSGSGCAAHRWFESQNGARRQWFASPQPAPRPCLLRSVLHDLEFATGGSAGNQIERGFFVLQETRTRL
jgi:hypothetical protein